MWQRHKRQRIEETKGTDEVDEFQDVEIADLNDTLSSIQLLIQRNSIPFTNLSLPALILQHQLYTILPNRTYVDQNLHQLRMDGTLVMFKIQTGPEDTVVFLKADYIALIRQYEHQLYEDTTVVVNNKAALTMFRTSFDNIQKQSILNMDSLMSLLRRDSDNTPVSDTDIQEQITYLQRLGFLRMTTSLDDHVFQLSIPGIGKFVTAVRKTRSQLLQILSRTKYKEQFEHQLKKIKLRYSKLNIDFHLTDMEGCGMIRRKHVPAGTLVSMVEK